MKDPVAGSPPALTLSDVTKSFGATRALKSVSMTVRTGTVHALVGENGAGKSTALGILAGRIPLSSGRVNVFGEELRYGDPRASRDAGVVAIYQELTVVSALSVEANVFLGQARSVHGFLAERSMRREYEELCERVGVKTHPPRTMAGSLSVADQQVLEILRALVADARIILFDEPTAALAVSERDALYRLIEGLRADGVTVVFVSHNLDEVLDLSDDITVFRDGELKLSEPRAGFTKSMLVTAMLGDASDDRIVRERLEDHEKEAARAKADAARSERLARGVDRPPILTATEIVVPGAVDGLEVEVRAGEMVGIGGLVGSGRSTLLRALAGLEPRSTGRLFIDGTEVAWPRTVRRALGYGIALVPEDRKRQGLVPEMSSVDNIALSDFRRLSTAGFLSPGAVLRGVSGTAADFGFKADRLRHRASHLSGGNQQKLLLARWKHVTPRILLTDEPTRGIDVGAKADVISALEAMARDGMGLVMVSSELEEVAAIADRVYVLAEGRLVGVLDRSGGDISTSDIVHLAFRVREGDHDHQADHPADHFESEAAS